MTGHPMDRAARRILLIDPDPTLRQTLAEALGQQGGLVPVAVATRDAALAALADMAADAVLLDGGMAGDGLIPALRAGGLTGPVIVLLSPGMAVPAGADDHVDRPIRLAALLSRLHALRPHSDPAQAVPATVLRIGPYRFLTKAKRLETSDGDCIRLTEKEAQILDPLCRRGGVAGRQDLLDAVWGYGAGIKTHTLETHIYRLRRKIRAGQGGETLLARVDGSYRLTLEPVSA